VDIMVAPPAPYLSQFAGYSTARLGVGAQDVSARAELQGAFTGEYSAAMLRSAGVKYAIVGHSERRTYHGETDELIGRKIAACLKADIIPVYCCGEVLAEREAGNHIEVVSKQVRTALSGFSAEELSQLVIAYEPVWAIGTGKTASNEEAQEMHKSIRGLIAGLFGAPFAERLRILYGGSMKPQNAAQLLAQPDIDGGLIGGASLVPSDFIAIIEAAAP
jgi:triosephosphate isomerase